MARSCGLRIGPRRFELVVLDGNPKKHKIAAYMAGELPREALDQVSSAALVIKEALKAHNVPKDNVGIAIDTGLAAFRNVKMPFADRAKIEQVIKFEVESLLPQWNIDDVVVDFLPLESTADTSDLLITAVQKADLKRVLSVCEKAGLEPQEAELETTAMVNAALSANVSNSENAQILVHIGEHSTSVVVMDSGHVREMRAIHIGALSHEYPAASAAIDAELALEGEEPLPPVPEVGPDPAEVQRRLEQAIKRIRRELGRTVSAVRTARPIESIFVCGLELPGLVGSSILDVPVLVLDVFEEDGGQPVEGFGQLVVPYGVALRQLGGGELHPSLRREELRYTGAFERIELPLAVVCLLIVTLLGVWNIFQFKEKTFVDSHLRTWRDISRSYLIGAPKQGLQGHLAYPSDAITKYTANLDADLERNKYEQLKRVQFLLNDEIKKLEKDLGQDAEITQPQSALTGAALVLGVLEKQGMETGRPSLRKLEATYVLGRAGKPDAVRVQLDITFFAQDSVIATQNYETFIRALQAEPWFVNVERKPNDTLEDGKGIFIPGMAVTVDTSKAPLAAASKS